MFLAYLFKKSALSSLDLFSCLFHPPFIDFCSGEPDDFCIHPRIGFVKFSLWLNSSDSRSHMVWGADALSCCVLFASDGDHYLQYLLSYTDWLRKPVLYNSCGLYLAAAARQSKFISESTVTKRPFLDLHCPFLL